MLVWLYVIGMLCLGAFVGAGCVAVGTRGGAARLVCVPVLALAVMLVGYSGLLFAVLVDLSTPGRLLPEGLVERLLAPYMGLDVVDASAAMLAPGLAGVAAGMGAVAGLRGPVWLLRLDLDEEETARALLCIAATRHPALTAAKLFMLRALLGPIPLLLYLGRICGRRRSHGAPEA